MKAKVRQVKVGTSVRYITRGSDGQTYSSNVTFTYRMADTIGLICFFQNHRFGETLEDGWFWQPELEVYYHESWLELEDSSIVTDDDASVPEDS